MFDKQHRHAFGFQVQDVFEQGLGERRVDPGHRLVEHDEARVAHQGAGHLEQLALATRHPGSEILTLGVELEFGEQAHGLLFDLGFLLLPQEREEAREQALTALLACPEFHVLEDSEEAEGLRQLEGSHLTHLRHTKGRHAVQLLAVERPVARIGFVETGEEIEKCRLAGSIGSDQGGDGSSRNLEVGDIHRLESAEGTGDVVGHDDRVDLLDARLSVADVKSGGLHRSARTGHGAT